MKELFNTQLPGGERPDIQLCIFPHLKEFLIIDMREGDPSVRLLSTAEVFTGDFFSTVEDQFSRAIREETEFPFAQLINLPLKLEESVRETAMTFIPRPARGNTSHRAIPLGHCLYCEWRRIRSRAGVSARWPETAPTGPTR